MVPVLMTEQEHWALTALLRSAVTIRTLCSLGLEGLLERLNSPYIEKAEAEGFDSLAARDRLPYLPMSVVTVADVADSLNLSARQVRWAKDYPADQPGQPSQKRMEFTTGRFYGPKPQTILAWQAGNNWRFYDAAREVAGEFPGLLPNSREVLARYDQGGYSALFLSRGELERARAADVQVCCKTCGGLHVKRDAWASWDPDTQEWVLEQVFDAGHCDDCDGETSLTEEPLPTAYEVWLPALPGPVTVRASSLEALAEVRACVGAKVWGDINTMNLYDLQSSL